MKILPFYFLVRINKNEQRENGEKISKDSPFFIPVSQVFNSRNMEHGEIVDIGDKMKDIYGWEGCKPGHTLIFHHTIETPQEKTAKRYFLYEDSVYNYYVVDEMNVRGFYDGEKIVPHPNFVFLKNIPAFPNMDDVDAATGNKVKKEGSIFLITNWEDSSQNIAQRSEKIKIRQEELAKNKRTPEIQLELERLQKEREQLNRKAQRKEYLPYRVAAANEYLCRDFGRHIGEDDVLFVFNKAAMYISNFKDKEYSYIIAMTEHIGGLLNNAWEPYQQFKARQKFENNLTIKK